MVKRPTFQELVDSMKPEPVAPPKPVDNELLFEKVLDREGNFATFRGILFELDWSYPQEGPVRSVRDIFESNDAKHMASWYDWVDGDVQFAESHTGVDFGRAKRFETKVQKILASL